MNLLSRYIEDNDRKTSQYNIRRISKISNNFSYYYKVFDPIDIWFKLLKIGTKIYVKFVSHPHYERYKNCTNLYSKIILKIILFFFEFGIVTADWFIIYIKTITNQQLIIQNNSIELKQTIIFENYVYSH